MIIVGLFQKIRLSLFRWKQLRYHHVLLLPVVLFVFAYRRAFKKNARRILITNTGGLGDLLMMSSLVRELSRKYEVDLVTNNQERVAALAQQSIYNNIYYIDFSCTRHFTQTHSRRQAIFKALCYYPIEYLKLSRRNYGAGINCGQLPWTAMLEAALLNALAIPMIAGFKRPDGAVLAMQHHTVDESGLAGPSFYLSLLAYFGIHPVSSPGLYFEVDNHSRDQMQRILKKIVGIDVNDSIAVVHPGGTPHSNSRRWPAEYYREVIAHLAKENYHVFISGMGPHDAEVCDFVHQGIGKSYNLCAQLTFQQLAALIEKAGLCISNDTSVVHLAVAVKCRMLIAIYGPTNSAFLARVDKNHFVVTSGLECSPCRKSMLLLSPDEPCVRAEKMECLKKIMPAQVIKLIDEHIHDRSGQ